MQDDEKEYYPKTKIGRIKKKRNDLKKKNSFVVVCARYQYQLLPITHVHEANL